MLRINQFNLEPGVYKSPAGEIIVVTTIVTHTVSDTGAETELADPLVVFRSIKIDTEHHKSSQMALTTFREHFEFDK